MSIEVREEDPRSATTASLIAALSAELAPLYGGDGTAKFKPEDVAGERAAFVVAWQDEKAVGCGALRPTEDEAVAEIKRMFVAKDARGLGISRQILTKLEELAAAYHYERIILETGIHQTEAIGLYEKYGFARMDCYEPYEDSAHSLCYEKSVVKGA
jgi:putative acetyltransferase